jgi:hypothetical protein
MSLPYLKCLRIAPWGCGCIHAWDVLIILPFLHLIRPWLKVIFKAAPQPCLPIIMKGGGYQGIWMWTLDAANICMISSFSPSCWEAILSLFQWTTMVLHLVSLNREMCLFRNNQPCSRCRCCSCCKETCLETLCKISLALVQHIIYLCCGGQKWYFIWEHIKAFCMKKSPLPS